MPHWRSRSFCSSELSPYTQYTVLMGSATLFFYFHNNRTLTEKGFKKIANSVDLSLNNLQGLVFKQLNGAAINMFYFLNTIAGFGRMTHFFEVGRR